MSAIKFRSSFRTCFIKEDIGSPDARYRFTWMGEELGHVLEKQKNDGGCVGLYRTILHQGTAQRLLSCQSCMPMSDQIPLVISEPVLSKKILALRCEVPIHMDGEEGGTWSRTCEARDQPAHVGSLTCLTSHRRIGLPWPLTALPNNTASRCGPTAPVIPCRCPRSNSARHFRTVLSKKILALQMRGTD
jgi:hypothetical protein